MDSKEVFKMAHKRAHETVDEIGDYQVAFKLALKHYYGNDDHQNQDQKPTTSTQKYTPKSPSFMSTYVRAILVFVLYLAIAFFAYWFFWVY